MVAVYMQATCLAPLPSPPTSLSYPSPLPPKLDVVLQDRQIERDKKYYGGDWEECGHAESDRSRNIGEGGHRGTQGCSVM